MDSQRILFVLSALYSCAICVDACAYYGGLFSYGPCSQTCGGGVQQLRRPCYDYDFNIEGYTYDTQPCNEYCLNGGRYYSGACHCQSGTRGTCCQDHTVCNPSCQSGGTCVSDQTCSCRVGTHGRLCEIVDPVCNPGCQNGGTCIADQTCSCPPKVHGRHCEFDVPICSPGCENGGACIADQTCKCKPGYYGQWCEAGDNVSTKYLPQLNTSLPLQDYKSLMSWYNVPDTSDYDRACYAKIHFQDAALDTLVTAESSYAGQLFGTYSEGPIDAHSQLNGTSRIACLQVKCPGSSMNGTDIDVHVNVTLTSKYKTCVLRNHTNLPGFSQDISSNSFGFTLEAEHNYGSKFGIYIGMGFRDKANHIARQSCLSGRRFDLTRINPALCAMADLICS